jgi:curved DNA-binding protein CbpA
MNRPGAPAALRTQIEELAAKLGTASHFELLAVAESASAEEIGAACMRLVRQLHPDRLASWGLPDLVDKASAVVARLNEASAVLTDPKRRAEYLGARSGKPAESGQSILAAEEVFQKGVVYLRKADHARAIESFAAAMKASPLEPSYKVHWVWARFEGAAPGGGKDSLAREGLRAVDEALKERPKFPAAHYWAGMLHKHLGDATKAEACFRTALGQQKSFLEAERELRVLEMRRSRAPQTVAAANDPARTTPKAATAVAAKQAPGILDRLLKR